MRRGPCGALSTEIGNEAAQALYRREGWTRDEAFHVYNLPVAPRGT